jgi:acyl-coenzyme A synthetase/AMP-(fatty) acid ligase
LVGLPEAISRHRPSVFGGVPSVYAGLTRGVSDIGGRDLGSLRLVMSTGSAMPLRIWQDLAEVFPKARRCLNYGLTETFRSATLRLEDEALAPSVVGSALPGAGLCVVDEAGQVLPAGQWGEVVHRGAGVFAGYWQDPEQTARRRRPDPLGPGVAVFTGDRGMLDAAGRLTLGDRIDRMVKVMGLQASPARIEAFLAQVPGVEAAAVISRPHEVLGAELVAVLVGGADTLKAAQAACRTLGAHERPRHWMLWADLPLTASGKVDLVRLAAEAGVRKDGQIAHPTAQGQGPGAEAG